MGLAGRAGDNKFNPLVLHEIQTGADSCADVLIFEQSTVAVIA